MKILRVDLHQVERRLRIISRTRPKAPQESSEEIYRRFHFVNSSETPLWFLQKAVGRTAKTFSPEQHSVFRELYLKFVGASTNAEEKSSSEKTR